MSQLGAPERSAQIFIHVAILKIKCTVKIRPAPDLGNVIGVSLISEKAQPRSKERRVRFRPPGCLQRTHTCDGIAPWAGAERTEVAEDDWQKMSGATRQPHTDTQQADVRDCMIRERAGSQGKEGSGIFRELCHPFKVSHRLGLNTAHT